ncbi:MAG: TraB/GumN family protein [Paludibacteraceae bacterium]|nr:TraB/GumN family protein [Paludibacteraceae bacterium]
MKKYLFIFVFCFSCLVANAQLLWQISGNGVSAKSYLLATDQLTDQSFFDSIPNLFKIYGQCSQLITEFEYNDSIMHMILLKAALLPDTTNLKKLYNTEEYNLLKEAVQLYLNLPIEQIGQLKPIYINELLRQQIIIKWADYNPDRSSDNFFQRIAIEQGMPMIGLDTTNEVVYIHYEREPLPWQQQELLRTIKYPEKEIQQAKTISRYYQNGKLNEIAYQVQMPDNQTSISYSDYKVYAARNKEWVKKLEPYLKEGNQMIVLNCIYLGGDDGLIAQLRKAGYKVKPVNK